MWGSLGRLRKVWWGGWAPGDPAGESAAPDASAASEALGARARSSRKDPFYKFGVWVAGFLVRFVMRDRIYVTPTARPKLKCQKRSSNSSWVEKEQESL